MIYIDNLCLKAFLPLPSPSGLANLGFDSYFSFFNIFYSFKYFLLLKLVYPCHPQVWPTWVARVTTMSHLLTVLSSSVSFRKQSWFGEQSQGECIPNCYVMQVNFYIYSLKHQRSLISMLLPSQSSEDRRGSSPVQFQVRKHLCTENSPSSEKVFQFWRTLQSPVPGSNTQRISPALILILILCFNFGEVSSPIWDGKAFIPAILLTLLQKVFKSPLQLQIHKPRYCDTKWRLCNHRIGRSVSFL